MFLALIQTVTDAVSDLAKEYKRMMQALALSILKDHQYAEDAVQEALFKISQNMDKIDNVKSARSRNFVYTVTKNTAISMARKIFSAENVTIEDLHAFSSIEGDVDVQAFSNRYGFGQELAEALSELEEIDKDIICYKYGAGYTSREIGKIVGIKPETVRKRMERALAKLQQIIEKSRKEGHHE